ncbi:hypothetical protein [Shewanella sp. AC91-MNA-CIBAN-0169]
MSHKPPFKLIANTEDNTLNNVELLDELGPLHGQLNIAAQPN